MGRFTITVCKDCPDRVVGCHSTCERYIAEKAERNKEMSKVWKGRHEYMEQIARTRYGIEQMKKGKKR